jgi:hypothetical protein
MRTTKAHILPGCVYCNFDHDPAIECRFMPESGRFQLPEGSLKMDDFEHQCEPIREATVKLDGVKHEHCICGASRSTITGGEWIIRDVCIAGESALNGVCGDPECVCARNHPIFGPVTYAYTRAQAIEDGTLINLGMFVSRGRPVLDWVGIRFPVAMTSTAYHDVTGEGEGPELLDSELITQRVLYLLGRLKRAILENTGDPTESRDRARRYR